MNSLQQVIEGGGEGVILRRPHSLYLPGRSSHLIKFKVCRDACFFYLFLYSQLITLSQGSRADREALVVDVEEDGSLLLQLYVKYAEDISNSNNNHIYFKSLCLF